MHSLRARHLDNCPVHQVAAISESLSIRHIDRMLLLVVQVVVCVRAGGSMGIATSFMVGNIRRSIE
jgi:hypothetical protein